MKVSISDIIVPSNRKRSLKENSILELMDSIKEIGLLEPIIITPDKVLISGLHRLEACKRLGFTEIECTVQQYSEIDKELAEIDENLYRAELTALERAELLLKRKEIYDSKHSEKIVIDRLIPGDTKEKETTVIIKPKRGSISKFLEESSKTTKLSPSTILQDIRIAKKIVPDVKTVIATSKIADTREDLIKLANMDPDTQKKVAEKLTHGEAKNVADAVRKVKTEEIKSKPIPKLPEGVFNIIYADPPWQYEFSESDSRKIESHYPTMSIDEICDIKVPAADNAVLFLWATAPKLVEALKVMNAWGFQYKTCAVWDKEVIGMGYWFRIQHELLLVGTRGYFAPPAPDARFSSVIKEKRNEHSKKPECVYEMIGKMYPGYSKLELFARQKRDGWTVWGNEI